MRKEGETVYIKGKIHHVYSLGEYPYQVKIGNDTHILTSEDLLFDCPDEYEDNEYYWVKVYSDSIWTMMKYCKSAAMFVEDGQGYKIHELWEVSEKIERPK